MISSPYSIIISLEANKISVLRGSRQVLGEWSQLDIIFRGGFYVYRL